MPQKEVYLEDDPLWYKDAIIYELHVKSFYDSNNDGVGDFKGLTEKLDYLKDLGITALWLLPFYPSPLKDDGYDIADYWGVHPHYGTLADFKRFLREAHRRGIRVITELVVNHTSDQHEWFQKSRRAKPGSVWKDFYVWSDTPERYKDARIIFKDFETSNWAWDHVAKAYYWHRFYFHQPDLNYDNPNVQKAVLKVIDYWMEMGVDGMRLDAVPYLYEREGTNCENLPETYEFMKKLRAYIDSKFRNRMLLSEANQWPEDAAAYFGNGDQTHMAFHFPLMPRIFMGSWMEDTFPIIDILDQTPPIPETCQWAIFLRNHDELTLEMVTDEERDYMYRVFAKDPTARINLGIRRRLAPLLLNHRRKIELMNILLFSFPGTPIIYYGDEIGMGDNYYLGDRNGVRTPMQWSADRNAGFSKANPQKLYLPIIIDPEYHYEALNAENQEKNLSSLLWWMRRVIAKRKDFKAFGRGSIEFLHPENPKVLAFIRQYQDENILVVVNLSRFSQVVELDLSRFAGYVPVEVFSKNKFPQIKESPYVLTLGFYDYFWFLLNKGEEVITVGRREAIPELTISESWEAVFKGKIRERLEEEILPPYIQQCRWFGGKARKLQGTKIVERIPIGSNSSGAQFIFLEVDYTAEAPDTYLLPVAFSSGERSERIIRENPRAAIIQLKGNGTDGVVHDGVYDEEFRKNLLLMIAKRDVIRSLHGEVTAYHGEFFRSGELKGLALGKSQVLKAEQSNTSILYGNRLFFKLYRRLGEGINPDLEITRFLTEKAKFPNIPSFAGAIEYKRSGSQPIVLGILQAFVPNQGDAWKYTLDSVERYLERVFARRNEIREIPKASNSLLEVASQEIPLILNELIGGPYIEMARLLGKRTAELHLALSSDAENPNFSPEPFSVLYQRSVFQSMQSLTKRVFETLKKSSKSLPDNVKGSANETLGFEKKIMEQFRAIFKKKLSAMKIRVHGDYHLGQVLFTGNDFFIIDFEGEPARSISERRLKRSPIRDVAGMIRSFHYAAYMALFKHAPVNQEDLRGLEPFADLWYKYISGVFLKSYLDTVKDAPFIPKDKDELDIMLRAYLLEKAVYELGYELNNRPDWVTVPIKGIKHLLE
ncbi:MAG TPA: maltose alpha-D-glucosyltransferase [Thermodesulfobacteriota bacterium]|nr:maltose alpha-D-glucosyltransferase [Thermodesulfobacteriota bacterium]